MRVTAFLGSPRHNGNGAEILGLILEEAAKNGNQVEMVSLYDKKINGCMACESCKKGVVKFCTQKDSMQELIQKIIDSDCIVIESPVYFGQITGVLKTFLDRWNTFYNYDYTIKYIKGKKLVLVTTCGAQAYMFKGVMDYLIKWFVEFFQLELIGVIMAGNMKEIGDINKQPDIIKKAVDIGGLL